MTAKEIILVTGGARSGKSRYAEQRALQLGLRRLYVATAEARDHEMAARLAAHKKRRSAGWLLEEEPVELPDALLQWRGRADCALVDCLTLWLSNLLLGRDRPLVEEKMEQLLAALPQLDFSVVLVSNEVGWGIVPDHPLGRRFRDLAGWANQRIGAIASEVILMVAGIPLVIKPRP